MNTATGGPDVLDDGATELCELTSQYNEQGEKESTVAVRETRDAGGSAEVGAYKRSVMLHNQPLQGFSSRVNTSQSEWSAAISILGLK